MINHIVFFKTTIFTKSYLMLKRPYQFAPGKRVHTCCAVGFSLRVVVHFRYMKIYKREENTEKRIKGRESTYLQQVEAVWLRQQVHHFGHVELHLR